MSAVETTSLSATTRKRRSLFISPVLDWTDAKAAREAVGLPPFLPAQKPEDSLDGLLETLSRQKADFDAKELRETRKKFSSTGSSLPSQTKRRSNAASVSKRSSSEPELSVPTFERMRVLGMGQDTKQLPSTMMGSAKFSIGPGYKKHRHLKGNYKVPVLDKRDEDYIPGGTIGPGPGHYDIRQIIGQASEEAGGGSTGGWMAGPHETFLRVFKGSEFREEATPEFFDKASVLLPEMSRAAIIQHVRWYADRALHNLKLEHTKQSFLDERLVIVELENTSAQTISRELSQQLEVSRKQRADEKRAMRRFVAKLNSQADSERERWGLKGSLEPLHSFKAEQWANCNGERKLVDGNMRAHPEHKKAPGYTWSASNEIRDVTQKRYTANSQVRSCGSLDNPGPGHYLGLKEHNVLLKRSPSCTLKGRPSLIPSMPMPDQELCMRTSELERRRKRAGSEKGEISVSLMWDTLDDLDLRVVPPGGRAGEEEISFLSRRLFGGYLDVCRNDDPGREIREGLENVSWLPYLGTAVCQAPSPPTGDYQVYLCVGNKRDVLDAQWFCRVIVGQHPPLWYSGVVAGKDSADRKIDICNFTYSGPVDSSTLVQKQLAATQFRSPSWKLGSEEARKEKVSSSNGNALTDARSTPGNIGPGHYTHSTSFHSQY